MKISQHDNQQTNCNFFSSKTRALMAILNLLFLPNSFPAYISYKLYQKNPQTFASYSVRTKRSTSTILCTPQPHVHVTRDTINKGNKVPLALFIKIYIATCILLYMHSLDILRINSWINANKIQIWISL